MLRACSIYYVYRGLDIFSSDVRLNLFCWVIVCVNCYYFNLFHSVHMPVPYYPSSYRCALRNFVLLLFVDSSLLSTLLNGYLTFSFLSLSFLFSLAILIHTFVSDTSVCCFVFVPWFYKATETAESPIHNLLTWNTFRICSETATRLHCRQFSRFHTKQYNKCFLKLNYVQLKIWQYAMTSLNCSIYTVYHVCTLTPG